MTSKISFHKLRMEDFRHRIAMMLLCLFAFLTWDLFYFISIRNAIALKPDNLEETLKELLMQFMAPNEGAVLLLTALAVVMAIMSFRYLHSKTKEDFFHALPVKRSRYFLLNLENDFLIFIFSYIISALIGTAISASHGIIDGSFGMIILTGAAFYIITFLMMYLLMTLCMILTGQTYVAIFGFGVITLYVPAALSLCYGGLANIFFATYSSLTKFQESILNRLSPLFLSAEMGAEMTKGSLVCGIAWILVLFIVSFVLFRILPSESAGRAMAFKKSEKMIKLLITVPLAILAGLFFYDITDSRTVLWLYFGIIVGAIFFHGIVEVIYQTDIAGLWSRKLDAVVILIITLAVVFIFHMDFVGFDNYNPDKEQVKTVKVIRTEDSMELGNDDSEEGGATGQDKEEILEVLEQVAQESLTVKNAEESRAISVSYFFEDGKQVKRKYYLSTEKEEILYNKLYESKEYKEKLFYVKDINAEDIVEIGADHPLESTFWKLSKEEKQEFLDAYSEDVANLTYAEVKEGKNVCKVLVSVGNSSNYRTYNLEIFPSYHNSIEFINKYEGDTTTDLASVNIQSLEVEYYEVNNTISGQIADHNFINSIKDKLYYSDLRTEYLPQEDDNLYITATYGTGVLNLYTDDAATREKIIAMIKK